MKRFGLLVVGATVFTWSAKAQTSVNAQTGATSNAQAAGQVSGVQAQSSTSASASQSAQSSSVKGQGTQASSGSAASASNSNSISANAGPNALARNDSTAVNAVLVNSLDAKKCKPGDKVEAKTTSDVKQDGQVLIKKGSRLHGHVTEAQARSKTNAESSLGMVFDSASLKSGGEVPLHLGVQALAAASSQTSAALADDEGMVAGGGSMAGSGRAAGGGLLGGAGGTVSGAAGASGGVAGNAGRTVSGTVGTTAGAAGPAAGNVGGLNAAGQLTSSSAGVFGLQGLSLASAATNATQASVVTSKTQNVHLDSGTQMLLRASKQ
jgi:hypothetical protein